MAQNVNQNVALTNNEFKDFPLGFKLHRARAEFERGGHAKICNLNFPLGFRLQLGYMVNNTDLDEYCMVLGPLKVNVDAVDKNGNTALSKPKFSLNLRKSFKLGTSLGLHNAAFIKLERTPNNLR